MLYNYEILTNSSSSRSVVNSEKILENGWIRRNYPPLKLDQFIPWELPDTSLRTWNWMIHSWDMLDPLLAAYSQTKDSRYLGVCKVVADDWLEKCSEQVDSDSAKESFAWYDMAVGLRSYRLAYLYDALLHEYGEDFEGSSIYWDSIVDHANNLRIDSNIQFHNNHGFYQVAGQMAMGRRFRHRDPQFEDAYLLGGARLKEMISRQYFEEGTHREHSPDYHRMVYFTVLGLIDSELIEDQETIEFVGKIGNVLSWYILPSLRLLNFGDSDYRLMNTRKGRHETFWHSRELDALTFKNVDAVDLVTGMKVFDQAGIAVVRSYFEGGESGVPSYSYLAQHSGFHSRTHKHADDMSFVWSEFGIDILVDAGRYGYIGKTKPGDPIFEKGNWYSDPNRIFCESTRAHNCLEIDGRDYLRKGAKAYGSGIKRRFEDSEANLYVIESECKHFNSIRCARLLFYVPGEWLIVYDWFNDNLNQQHDVKQWFHFHPDLKVDPIDRRQFSTDIVGKTLRVSPLLDGVERSDLNLAESRPHMQGWWSPAEREIVPSYALNYSMRGNSSGSVATLFQLTSDLTVNFERSKCNKSGRKGQFRWSNSSSQKSVSFERLDRGELAVEYKIN